mmetsp:Transcript_55109/g.89535  ORF Transcript_55109/g.89535 Transcript_55109/m.89535 type:complete len:392 (-) Transcript_55109:3380-4555(-)
MSDIALVSLRAKELRFLHRHQLRTSGQDNVRFRTEACACVGFHLDNECWGRQLFLGRLQLELSIKLWHPLCPRGLPLFVILLVGQTHGHQPLRTQLSKAVIEILAHLVVIHVCRVTECKHCELSVRQPVTWQCGIGDGLQESLRIVRELSLSASGCDHEDLVLVGQIVKIIIVHGLTLGAHVAPLQFGLEHLRYISSRPGLRSVQHQCPFASGGFSEHGLQMVQQLEIVHGLTLQILMRLMEGYGEVFEILRCLLLVLAQQLLEAILRLQELFDVGLDLGRVKLQRHLALCCQARVIAIELPVTAVHSNPLTLHLILHINPPVDARRVAQEERGSIIGLGLADSLDRLVVVGTNSDRCNVHITVCHSHHAKVLLHLLLATLGKLEHCTLLS